MPLKHNRIRGNTLFEKRIFTPTSHFLVSAFALLLIFYYSTAYAGSFQSAGAGAANWSAAASWTLTAGTDADGVPDANDDVTILSGHTINLDANNACNNLTITGSFLSTNGNTHTVNGDLVTNPGSTIGRSAGLTATLNVLGNYTVNAGGSSDIGRINFSVGGSTTIYGTAQFSNGTGTKSFGDALTDVFTVASGASINYSANPTINISGDFISNGGISILGTATASVNIVGNLTCNSGITDIGRGNLTVSGLTTVNGTLYFSFSATGGKNFNNGFIVNAGGSVDVLSTEDPRIAGDIIFDGPVTASGGGSTWTMKGPSPGGAGAQSISGTSTMSVTALAVNAGVVLTNSLPNITISGNLSGGTGTFINTANTSLYIGGNATIGTLTATAVPNTVTYNGSGNQTGKTTGYYDLTINNSGVGNTVTFGAGANMDVADLLYIQRGDMNYTNSNNQLTGNDLTMDAGTRLRIATDNGGGIIVPQLTGIYTLASGSYLRFSSGNDQNIKGSIGSNTVPYQNIEFTGAGSSKFIQADLYVDESLSIASSAILNSNAQDIFIKGNWTNSSTNADPFVQGTGLVTFNGVNPQTISNTGDQQGTEFYDVTVNNASTTGVTLSGSAGNNLIISTAGTLTLTDGYVYSSTSNLVQINSGAFSSGGSANSFVDGPVKKIGNSSFIFPTGDDVAPAGFGAEDVWARLGISAPATATTEFTAKYNFTSYSDLTVDATLAGASAIEYWNLDRAINADNVNVTLYFEDATRSSIDDVAGADLVVARYNGTDWTNNGQSSISGTSPGSVTSSLVSSFNTYFTFGSRFGSNPLPIELLFFRTKCDEGKVTMNWSTASELNNDYFTIERTQDGMTFKNIGIVDGAGNSTQIINYSFEDNDPLASTYYRLKQTDFDGKSSYSDIVSADCNTIQEISIFPNPSNGKFSIRCNEQYANLLIINSIGEAILNQQITSERTEIDLSGFHGICFVRIISPGNGKNSTRKIVVN